MSKVSIPLSDVLASAKGGDTTAVVGLFQGFLSKKESLMGCGYLGSLGFLFPEHSFWCVTNIRACSLRIKRGGELVFSSGYLKHINSDAFYQPSLITLWIIIAALAILTFGIGLLLLPWVIKAFYRVKKSGVVFCVREGIPVYIFEDRQNLSHAQHVSTLISEAISGARV